MHAQAHTHTQKTQRGAGCACVFAMAEQRDPFCQSGQCWKRFKATSTVDILSCPFACFIALTLFNMFGWNEKLVHRNALAYPCKSVFVTFASACVCVTKHKRQLELAWRGVPSQWEICCNYAFCLFTLLWGGNIARLNWHNREEIAYYSVLCHTESIKT